MRSLRKTAFSCGLCVAFSVFSVVDAGEKAPPDVLLDEEFEGGALKEADGWEVFRGFRGEPPRVRIAEDAGRDGTAALTVAHTESFRTDNWGLGRRLAEPIADGVVWLECHFHPPREWTGNVYLDARGGRSVVGRIGGERYQPEEAAQAVLRAHASQVHSYWRMYGDVPLEQKWYRLTMRLDLDAGTYAAWVDDQVLGEELSLCSREPIDHVHLGLGGTAASPARIDDLRITRAAPEGRELRPLLPEPEDGRLFRMAVVGDPQLGFSSYDADLKRFRQTVEQINRSGAELTLVMGDMVHDNDNEAAYRDLKQAAEKLNSPVYYVRGNHERLDLYQKYFHPNADFAAKHAGWRFVFLDAIGNQTGLKDEQLAFAEKEFREAQQAGEELVLCIHVSPWQDNEKGRGAYNQIGPGRDKLVELLDEYDVLFSLSGHYHRGLWRVEKQGTHHMVFPGTAQVKHGWLGWCTFDVYPDRVVVHEKPVYFGYVRPDAKAFYNFNYRTWTPYAEALQQYPYLQHGPAVIPRRRASGDE